MDLHTWSAFLLASLVTAFTPGQAVLLAVSNALELGRRRAMFGSLGNAAGLLLLAGATLGGLGLLLRAWPAAFEALKLLGACYLVWLGVRAWRPVAAAPAAGGGPRQVASAMRIFLQGLGVALTNPKGILFFGALFPQFARTGEGLAGRFALMTATFVACAVCAHLCFIAAAPWARRKLASRRAGSLVRRLGGLLFILLGLAMLRLRLPG